MKTRLTQAPLAGVLIVDIDYFNDERGFFIESWHKRDFEAAGLAINVLQEGHSRSKRNVLRGLHYQNLKAPMGKLVRCTRGSIYDVVVDLRVSSPTFGKWFAIELNEKNKKQIYVPVGFAHGFLTLSPWAELQYKQTGYYTPEAEGTLSWNDPDMNIPWKVRNPIVSTRDQHGMSLRQYSKNPAFA